MYFTVCKVILVVKPCFHITVFSYMYTCMYVYGTLLHVHVLINTVQFEVEVEVHVEDEAVLV